MFWWVTVNVCTVARPDATKWSSVSVRHFAHSARGLCCTVPHVRHRYDLTYVIGEMISELNIGHAYVGGGEAPEVARIKTGLLDSASRWLRCRPSRNRS